jgi:O-antigen/teichoic acid export membrane protein
VFILILPAGLGAGQLVVREIAIAFQEHAWSHLRGVLRWANVAVLISTLLVTVAAATALYIYPSFHRGAITSFLLALFLIPLSCLSAIRFAALRGINRIIISQFFDQIFVPALFLIGVGSVFLFASHTLTTPTIIFIRVMAFLFLFVVSSLLISIYLPSQVRVAKPEYQSDKLLKSTLPFVITASMHVINRRIDLVMVGALLDFKAAGLFAIASFGAQFIVFIIESINTAVAPTVSALYRQGDLKILQQIVAQSSVVVFISAVMLSVLMVFIGTNVLAFFGPEYIPGYRTLLILCFGRAFQTSMGLSGMILNMTNHERQTAISTSLGAILNIALNYLLIPLWGIEGAAWATIIGGVVTVTLLNFQCAAKMNIDANIYLPLIKAMKLRTIDKSHQGP